MALPMGAGFWQYTEEYHESNSSMPQQAPNANGNSYGSSLFRKKNRFGAGHDTPAADTAPLLTPPDRPATSSAHSRRGSRGSSITSLNDLKNPTLRRRSASLRKNPAAAASIEMLAPTTSRETRPPTASQEPDRPTLQRTNTAPAIVFNRIHDLAAKRISTLDYLKKTHDGKTYWLNTHYFNRNDLSKLAFFEQQKLTRRAVNYFMLGNSIPAVLDPNANNVTEYLRTFNALLGEFDSYQSMHPPDGSTSSALPRVRVPQMFKRSAGSGAGKARRGSGIGDLSISTSQDDAFSPAVSHAPSFPGHDRELLPGEDYVYLLTPWLPFDPDYYETFATLCDVLIDCYTTVLGLVTTPEIATPAIADLFMKADTRVKKLLVNSLVRDLEQASKQGVRAEMSGVGKVVLGGLM